MNLYEELDRMTAPPSSASPVRVLSPKEIEALMNTGQITPIDQVPLKHFIGRIHYPKHWHSGTFE